MTTPIAPGISSRRGLHRVVVDALGLRIVSGELGAGATLPTEADLSAELGVSRTVVREAIKVLAAKGLVESRPKVGTRARGRAHWNLVASVRVDLALHAAILHATHNGLLAQMTGAIITALGAGPVGASGPSGARS